uniref:Sugar transporter SWEET1 n=1 Tax=Meloidogyne incognita TaxID=6306 RepID=A0A914NU99_MELIC
MLCLANMTVCLQWLLYGFLVDDLYMKVPNSIGTIISSVQLSLFVIYPRTYKVLFVRKSNV